MLDVLNKFNDVIIFDTTFKRNSYNLSIALAVVVDGAGKSLSGFLAIMSSENSTEFRYVFAKLKERSFG